MGKLPIWIETSSIRILYSTTLGFPDPSGKPKVVEYILVQNKFPSTGKINH